MSSERTTDQPGSVQATILPFEKTTDQTTPVQATTLSTLPEEVATTMTAALPEVIEQARPTRKTPSPIHPPTPEVNTCPNAPTTEEALPPAAGRDEFIPSPSLSVGTLAKLHVAPVGLLEACKLREELKQVSQRLRYVENLGTGSTKAAARPKRDYEHLRGEFFAALAKHDEDVQLKLWKLQMGIWDQICAFDKEQGEFRYEKRTQNDEFTTALRDRLSRLGRIDVQLDAMQHKVDESLQKKTAKIDSAFEPVKASLEGSSSWRKASLARSDTGDIEFLTAAEHKLRCEAVECAMHDIDDLKNGWSAITSRVDSLGRSLEKVQEEGLKLSEETNTIREGLESKISLLEYGLSGLTKVNIKNVHDMAADMNFFQEVLKTYNAKIKELVEMAGDRDERQAAEARRIEALECKLEVAESTSEKFRAMITVKGFPASIGPLTDATFTAARVVEAVEIAQEGSDGTDVVSDDDSDAPLTEMVQAKKKGTAVGKPASEKKAAEKKAAEKKTAEKKSTEKKAVEKKPAAKKKPAASEKSTATKNPTITKKPAATTKKAALEKKGNTIAKGATSAKDTTASKKSTAPKAPSRASSKKPTSTRAASAVAQDAISRQTRSKSRPLTNAEVSGKGSDDDESDAVTVPSKAPSVVTRASKRKAADDNDGDAMSRTSRAPSVVTRASKKRKTASQSEANADNDESDAVSRTSRAPSVATRASKRKAADQSETDVDDAKGGAVSGSSKARYAIPGYVIPKAPKRKIDSQDQAKADDTAPKKKSKKQRTR